jgi:hypothetical protein
MQGSSSTYRRKPRSAVHLLVRFGVVACGVAGGLVELLALQRCRMQQRPERSKAVWHR